jgi:nitrate reductase NapAB chaperone NapD
MKHRPDTEHINNEVHISSVVVFCKSEYCAEIEEQISQIEDCDVYASEHSEGKIVVIIEASGGKRILDKIDAIQALENIIRVTPVYHQYEPESELNKIVEADSL